VLQNLTNKEEERGNKKDKARRRMKKAWLGEVATLPCWNNGVFLCSS